MKQVFTAALNPKLNKVYSWHFIVPDEVVKAFQEKDITRFLVTINEQLPQHSGMLSLGQGQRYITINKSNRKSLNLQAHQVLTIEMKPDFSEFGIEVPEEFEVMLSQDEEASELFRKLTPGKQRNLIHWVGNVKSQQIRIRRALVVLRHLKKYRGQSKLEAK